MKPRAWQLLVGIVLILLTVLLYTVHYLIFKDTHHIFIFLFGDLAFLPLEVLLVTIIIHELLNEREKRDRLRKLNMVIGAFFSEVGTTLLRSLARFDGSAREWANRVSVSDCSAQGLGEIRMLLAAESRIDVQNSDLEELHVLLLAKRDFLLRLLENPTILEHESFTELLWAVFHLTDELANRVNLRDLSAPDRAHLAADIKQAYDLLIVEWFKYIKHLKADYPYLYSLATRMNPFDPKACAEVRE